eukprot:3931840-Rhodomonas_salina.1
MADSEITQSSPNPFDTQAGEGDSDHSVTRDARALSTVGEEEFGGGPGANSGDTPLLGRGVESAPAFALPALPDIPQGADQMTLVAYLHRLQVQSQAQMMALLQQQADFQREQQRLREEREDVWKLVKD